MNTKQHWLWAYVGAKNLLLVLIVFWAIRPVYRDHPWKMAVALAAMFFAFVAVDLFLLWRKKGRIRLE